MKSTDVMASTLDNANQPGGRNIHARGHNPFFLSAYAPSDATGGTTRHHRWPVFGPIPPQECKAINGVSTPKAVDAANPAFAL